MLEISKPQHKRVLGFICYFVFSGHFSLEKISAVDTDVIIKTDECQVPTTDINDLSSLAWLTGVDVQVSLQKQDYFVMKMTHPIYRYKFFPNLFTFVLKSL